MPVQAGIDIKILGGRKCVFVCVYVHANVCACMRISFLILIKDFVLKVVLYISSALRTLYRTVRKRYGRLSICEN